MATNLEDIKRDLILRFLYEHHKTARGIATIPIGVLDLKREMKERHDMKQNEVSSNLDYLIQVCLVREDVKARHYRAPDGTELSRDETKYKISATGIDCLEGGTIFIRPESGRNVNIASIPGVTVVGEGQIVNLAFTDLARALDELDQLIAASSDLSDEQMLDAAGDLAAIRGQIAKKNPNHAILAAAWDSLKATTAHSAEADTVGKLEDYFGNTPSERKPVVGHQ